LLVLRVILKSDNFLKRLFKTFGVINTITDEHQNNEYLKKNSRINNEYDALTQKQKHLEELKNKIKNFRENVEKMDFIKNLEKSKNSENAKSNFDDQLNHNIDEILSKNNGEFDEDDIKRLNNYINQIKKNK